MGAVTVFQQNFPGATVKSISYDAKHNPYYEVEGYYNHRQVEIKVDEATGQIVGKEVKGYTIDNKAINVQNIIIPEVAETKAIEKLVPTSKLWNGLLNAKTAELYTNSI